MNRPSTTTGLDPIALQLWTIREAMASDVDAALRRARNAGFQAVELGPLPPGVSTGQLADCLERHRLAVVSIHADLPDPGSIASWAGLAETCRCSKLIWHGWPRDPRFDSPAGVSDLIADCNRACGLARDHGLRFGMHNHWWEFEPVEGTAPIRVLHERLDPKIFWQLDVYWARTAGRDPAGVIAELGPRIGSIHWKDGPAIQGEPMTALGTGTLDLPGAFRSLTRPVDWVVELDECAIDPLEAARQGLAYLESLRGDPGGRPG